MLAIRAQPALGNRSVLRVGRKDDWLSLVLKIDCNTLRLLGGGICRTLARRALPQQS